MVFESENYPHPLLFVCVCVVCLELVEAKSLLAQAELIKAIGGNHPLGKFLREIPSSCGRKPFKGKVRC